MKDIVLSLGNEMGLELDKEDISTAHVLPTFDKGKDDKMIVKFTRRSVRNDFYGNRKEVAGSKVSSISSLAKESDKKVYISESLTPSKKKLFGVVNKLRKKLQCKYIWSNNGRIYLKQAANSAETYKFDSPVDLAKFVALMKQPPPDLTKKFHLTHKPSTIVKIYTHFEFRYHHLQNLVLVLIRMKYSLISREFHLLLNNQSANFNCVYSQ